MSPPPIAEASPHAGFAPGGHRDQIRSLETVTEIQAYIMRESPGINKRFAERSAKSLARINGEEEFFEAMRVLGIHPDPTARKAILGMCR